MTREELAAKYDQLYKDMHDEFFETINVGTPEQQRRLRADKTTDQLNARHAEITLAYNNELIANGFPPLDAPPEPPEPTPDEARLAEIVATSPEAITMPDIWEAIRILAKFHNIGE